MTKVVQLRILPLSHIHTRSPNLFFRSLSFFFILVNVEVTELISVLSRSNNVHKLAQLVLLQELLGQVLEVALAEVDVTDDGDLGGVALDFDGLAELAGFAVDLELVVQEVFLKKRVKFII